MTINQILVRPSENVHIIQYTDVAGRTGRIVASSANNTAIAKIIEDSQGLLPQPEDHPEKEQVELEIADLESRLTVLRESIGEAP